MGHKSYLAIKRPLLAGLMGSFTKHPTSGARPHPAISTNGHIAPLKNLKATSTNSHKGRAHDTPPAHELRPSNSLRPWHLRRRATERIFNNLQGIKMKKYKVISSQIVYSYTYIDAQNEEEAEQLAFEGDHKWQWYDCGAWELDEVEEVE